MSSIMADWCSQSCLSSWMIHRLSIHRYGNLSSRAVAHQLPRIKEADAICVFQGGRSGGEEKSLRSWWPWGGLYRKMCEVQNLD